MARESIDTFPVLFSSGGLPIVGRVYRHAGSLNERQPGVLVTGSWLTVKEQMAARYATALAERGFTAITFDFTGWGQSGGGPRHAELPSRKIADIVAAASFASTLSFVQPGGVGYLGVCASAQYALAAVAHGAPIKSYASVAGWFHDTTSVAPFYGGTEGVDSRLRRAEKALDVYTKTGEVVAVPAYDPGDDRAGMTLEMDYYASPTRGAVPEWPNQMAEMSWLPWLTFDGLSGADVVSVPSLFVHSNGCVFPDHIDRLRRSLRGPVDVVWGEGTQTDFYDQPAQVETAVDALDAHFSGMRKVPA
jgi:fermentation-respiration switch protein FrsA (DUF1100 family)